MPSQKSFVALTVMAAKNYSTSTQGSAIDLQGYINPGGRTMKGILVAGEGAGTTVAVDVKFQDSNTTTASDFTDISGATFTTIATTGISAIQQIHFQTRKRYIRAASTHGTNFTNATYSVIVIAEQRFA
jgi:hypothetical protein